MRDYFLQHKYHFFALGILSFIAVIGWNIEFPYITDSTKSSPLQDPVITSTPSGKDIESPAGTKTSKNVYTNVDIFNSQTADEEVQQDQSTQVVASDNTVVVEMDQVQNTLVINDKKYRLAYTNGMSVYAFMKELEQQGLRFSARNYGASLGKFVTEINGIKNEDEPGKYWFYSVNGEKATVGISNYTLKPHDIITWTYEKSEL